MPAKSLSVTPHVHPTAEIADSTLGAYTEVGARTRPLEVGLSDYSYIVNDSDVAYTTFGKFCSVAAMTRINPARVIRQRFPDAVAARLQSLAWWNWSHGQLRTALPDFRRLSAETFLDTYERSDSRRLRNAGTVRRGMA